MNPVLESMQPLVSERIKASQLLLAQGSLYLNSWRSDLSKVTVPGTAWNRSVMPDLLSSGRTTRHALPECILELGLLPAWEHSRALEKQQLRFHQPWFAFCTHRAWAECSQVKAQELQGVCREHSWHWKSQLAPCSAAGFSLKKGWKQSKCKQLNISVIIFLDFLICQAGIPQIPSVLDELLEQT